MEREIESVFTKDELLTMVMIYQVARTINFSTCLYYECTHQSTAAGQRVEVPTAVAVFPVDIPVPSRSLAQRFCSIQH